MDRVTVYYLMWHPTPGQDGVTEWFANKEECIARGTALIGQGFKTSGYPAHIPTTPEALASWLNDMIDTCTWEEPDPPETP